MRISDGAGGGVEIKDYAQIHAELFVRYLKTRRVHPTTFQIKDANKKEFLRDLHNSIKIVFKKAFDSHSIYMRGLALEDVDDFWTRTRAFEAEAKRIRDTEYTAKAEAGASS